MSLLLVGLMDLESDVDNIYEVEKILDAKRKVSGKLFPCSVGTIRGK